MAWVDWVLIAEIVLLAVAIFAARKQRGSYLNRPNFLAWKRGPVHGCREPKLAVASRHVRARRDPVKEAITDGLTGLKTPCHFTEALDGEWRRSAHSGRQFSLIRMDFDRFKQVNDRMGRLEGDKVLTKAATLLDARTGRSNLVARYGGDEFAILVPEANTLQAENLGERLRAALEADDVLRAHEVTVSIGIAAFPDHGRTPEEVLKVADAGVSLAKRCGGNCVKVAPLSPKPEDAERNKRLLEVYLEAAAKGMFCTVPGTYQHEFEKIKPLWDTISALAFAVEANGPYMKDHSQAVSRLTAQIAIEAGLSYAEAEEIRLGGLVHDIGNIHVPEHVRKKPTRLTAEECDLMKSHPVWGAKILEPLNVKAIERIVRHHHERYDGKGYPDGLAADKIPLGARIVAVAECFHNMVSELSYKSARTIEDAVAELRRCSGTQFDHKVVTALLDWLETHSDRPEQP